MFEDDFFCVVLPFFTPAFLSFQINNSSVLPLHICRLSSGYCRRESVHLLTCSFLLLPSNLEGGDTFYGLDMSLRHHISLWFDMSPCRCGKSAGGPLSQWPPCRFAYLGRSPPRWVPFLRSIDVASEPLLPLGFSVEDLEGRSCASLYHTFVGIFFIGF